ncbi:hypothetical protein ElyMa_004505600 [Elysia marginata]|uniref:Uncharacterized protein n=1 Tax=Elysia marginata TaxID=1093978 RepID=A0AAV4HMB5_9GAST|nr:hypothetical protein ElyMa_004505600 [Elysia marginata]
MEKIEKFQIVFNNPSATYLAGETVYGYGWIVIKEPVYVSRDISFPRIVRIFKIYYDESAVVNKSRPHRCET